MYTIDSVSALVFDENRANILMVKQTLKHHSKMDSGFASNDFWCLPGGKIDRGETPLDALSREIWEETGLNINPATSRVIYNMVRMGDKFRAPDEFMLTVSMFLCNVQGGMLTHTNDPDKHILAAKWIPYPKIALNHIRHIPDMSYNEPLLAYLGGNERHNAWGYEMSTQKHNGLRDMQRMFPKVIHPSHALIP